MSRGVSLKRLERVELFPIVWEHLSVRNGALVRPFLLVGKLSRFFSSYIPIVITASIDASKIGINLIWRSSDTKEYERGNESPCRSYRNVRA